MTEKELMTLIEKQLKEHLTTYLAAADAEHTLSMNENYNIGRIHAIKAILWEMEDIKDLYDI